jgi:hypothetical protein
MKLSLSLALLLAALGGIAALWGNAELHRANSEARQAATQYHELQRQLASLQDRETEALAARFATLQAQGFFNQPPARAISARLQAAREKLDIADVQHVLQTPQLVADGLMQQNRMDIELDVLHEQKFVDFWHTLNWSLPLQVTSCSLERTAANLKARCQVHWLTAAPSGEKE